MRKSLEVLRQLAPPPKEPLEVGESPDWNAIEKKLGLKFPPDYRELVTTYGSGGFSWYNHRIQVLNPFAAEHYRRMCDIAFHRLMNVNQQRRRVVFSERNGLYPWGYDGDGCMLLWRTGGPPSQWPTLTYSHSGNMQRFRLTSTTFLARALGNQISVPIWSLPFTVPRRRVFRSCAIAR